jgi:uncharacterized protein YeaO (DUF488 family)
MRVLVDRVWPRGLSKDKARLDEWSREVAPSTGLRRWYGHDPARFEEFCEHYRAELADDQHREAVERLRGLAGSGPLTLLTATTSPERSQAPVLAELLKGAR